MQKHGRELQNLKTTERCTVFGSRERYIHTYFEVSPGMYRKALKFQQLAHTTATLDGVFEVPAVSAHYGNSVLESLRGSM